MEYFKCDWASLRGKFRDFPSVSA